MKKSILLILCLLVSVSLFSQVQTVITGKVVNNPKKPVILLVYNFSTATMEEEEIMIQQPINEDGSFSFSTAAIVRPLTRCRLGFNNEGIEIILNPGDTLGAELQYGTLDSTTTFSGSRASRNNYLKLYDHDFPDRQKSEIFNNFNTRDTLLINSLTDLRNSKIELLDSLTRQLPLDSLFYNHEKSRINYEYLVDLIYPNVNESVNDSVYNQEVLRIIGQGRFSDDTALVTLREYRAFIRGYMNLIRNSDPEDGFGFNDRMKRIDTELSGLTRSYCSWELISNKIQSARDPRQKSLLKKYFTENSSDPVLLLLLDTIRVNQSFRNGMDYRRIIRPVIGIMAFMLFLFLLAYIVYKNQKILQKSGKHLNFKLFMLFGLLAIIVIMGFSYLRYRIPSHGMMTGVLCALVPILFLWIHSAWLMPAWFSKKKYAGYGFLLMAFTVLYFLAFYLLGHKNFQTGQFIRWFLSGSTSVSNSWLILMPLSFVYYYINKLIKDKKDLGYLFSKTYLNPEFFINLLIICFLFFGNSLGRITQEGGIRFVLYFISAGFIFYLNAFYLAPKYLQHGRFGIYLLISVAIMMGSVVVIYLMNVFNIYYDLTAAGLDVPLTWAFMPPRSQDIYAGVVLQIVTVPALIYAFVRYQVSQKSIGFRLFRNKEAELLHLRSQVNPHFLFNSLNTLYSFALKENNTKTAEYIAKLANLMRYLVDDMQKEMIPVKNEINYIRDYINLQAIRSSVEHKIEISDSLDEDQNLMIAPMLMIPFVENAFKHGINPNSISELKVNFQITGDQFQFVIENSVDKNFEAFYKEKGFGIGIGNVRQRLEHIYPGRHTLSIADTGGRFIVILTVEVAPRG